MKQYTIGIDYGTLSARAVLVDCENGAEVAVAEFVYPHGILKDEDFSGITLENDAALQDPQDYLDAAEGLSREILQLSGVSAEKIVGVGIDFTSSTVLPVLEDGTPLCFLERYRNQPQAYVKLWKHHGGQKEADEITELVRKRGETWLERYGGKVSSEWMFPKLVEILQKAPEVYEEMARYIEAGDWLVWMLTGVESHNSCMAGFKSFWSKEEGYPSNEFWRELDPRMSDVIGTKISEAVIPTGTKAGEINDKGAKLTGLCPGTAVAAPIIDAHASLPAAGIVSEGKMMLIVGTSGCHIMLGTENQEVEGICGRVTDGILPGFVAYEAGQSCVGDCFDWFIHNGVPEEYSVAARNEGKSIFSYLDEKAEGLKIGASGLLVLDWWNGNRSPLADFDLSGMILGLNLQTKPEEIYRAILEGVVFGTKTILELFEKSGVCVEELYASGGISRKNGFLMQMFADVLGKKILLSSGTQSGAKGSAMLGAVAAGVSASIAEAAEKMSDPCEKVYLPNAKNTEKYASLYREYLDLSNYFARGGNDVMKRLRKIATEAKIEEIM